ncbi:MAG: winged helix-turn-helix transcriptional regulator [Candidatus Thermoplasmatota archaeon]|nr:winged helix-turn-helix transcriptional regulator [Candidatus Thermoplasmatota archaeon]
MALAQDLYHTVNFTLYDESKELKSPKLKGSFGDWELLPMEKGPKGDWTYTHQMKEGTYEWGVIEPDDSELGIWLPSRAGHRVNLVFTVNESGEVEGVTSIRIPAEPWIERLGSLPFIEMSGHEKNNVDSLLKLLSKASMLSVIHVIIMSRVPLRFGKIQSLADISATSLSRRLKELEKAGLVRRRTRGKNPPIPEYQATQILFELEPSLNHLHSWISDNHPKLNLDDS